MRHTTIDIHGANLTHNLNIIKRHAPTAHLMAMVKSNAYGHGVTHCLPALLNADAFGVATLAEGLEVDEFLQKNNSPKDVVLIEGVFSADEWQTALTHHFGCVIHYQEQVEWALAHTPDESSFSRTVWLKYNTGMNRLGFDRESVLTVAKQLHDKGYRLILTSHFACADEPDNPANALQIERFNDVLALLQSTYPNVQGSLCNSAGIFNFPHAHHQWVRAGIALYGGSPVANRPADELGLRPAMTFATQIFATHELNAGESVGYGGLWTAERPSRIGVLSVGYGDGYPRVVNGAKVLINKENQSYLVPIIGRVAMDMLMIDITNLPVKCGNRAILWGEGLSADTVADWANTISYELFCKTSHRPTRRSI